MNITISIKKLYEENNKETGVIVTSHTLPTNSKDRYEMETIMKYHVHQKIFPNTGISFYPFNERGLVSFIALININGMKEVQVPIDYTLHFQ